MTNQEIIENMNRLADLKVKLIQVVDDYSICDKGRTQKLTKIIDKQIKDYLKLLA